MQVEMETSWIYDPPHHAARCDVFDSCVWSVPAFGIARLRANKSACGLPLHKADAEAALGVTLQPPKPTAPFRSLLDPDFTKGTS